VTHQAV